MTGWTTLALTLGLLTSVSNCQASAQTERRSEPVEVATEDPSRATPIPPPRASTPASTAPPGSSAGPAPAFAGTDRPGRVGSVVQVGGTRFVVWGAAEAGAMPKGLAASPDGQRLFATNMGVDGVRTLSVYRTDPLRLERHLDLAGKAIEVAPSNDGRELYVSNSKAWGTLQIFSLDELRLLSEVSLPGFPKWLLPAPDGRTLFASLWALDGVSRVDLKSGTVRTLRTTRGSRTRHAGGNKNPRGMALSADGRTLVVANNADESLSLLDVASFTERKRIRIGYAPRHIVATAGHSVYVSLTGNDSVLEFDVQREAAVRELPVGKRPKTLALSRDERFLYVGNYGGNSLGIVELSSGRHVELPLDLHKVSGVAVRQDDRFVYVTGFCTHDVWAVERLEHGSSPTLPLGSHRENEPCLDCPSSFEGCPYYPGPRAITPWQP